MQGGSPPHAWGQLDAEGLTDAEGRFTPTRVGTISLELNHLLLYPVHPHTRGDNRGGLKIERDLYGSPPHAWGQFWLIP